MFVHVWVCVGLYVCCCAPTFMEIKQPYKDKEIMKTLKREDVLISFTSSKTESMSRFSSWSSIGGRIFQMQGWTFNR